MGCESEIKKDKNYNPIDEIKNGKILNLNPNHNASGDTIVSKIIFDSCAPTKIINHTISSNCGPKGLSLSSFMKELIK